MGKVALFFTKGGRRRLLEPPRLHAALLRTGAQGLNRVMLCFLSLLEPPRLHAQGRGVEGGGGERGSGRWLLETTDAADARPRG